MRANLTQFSPFFLRIFPIRRAAGPKLRADDPAGLRDFILRLQERSAAAQAATTTSADGSGADGAGLSTRARLLLELVCDLKNGKHGGKLGGGGAASADEFPPVRSHRIASHRLVSCPSHCADKLTRPRAIADAAEVAARCGRV
jgi:hypothetical protein